MGTPVSIRRLPAVGLFGVIGAALAPQVEAQPHQTRDEIVVTGVPRERAPGEIAQSVTVVAGDALDRARAATLGETLSNQLGVSSSSFGAGASRPIIRGLAGARVQMLEDGIGSMDVATVSDDHAVTIEPLAADQIEIFRGPTTLLYGSGAVGGVVNTVTTRIPTRVPEGGFAGALELRGDSVADNRGAAVRLDGGGSRFAWHVDAGRRESADYEVPGFTHADVDFATAVDGDAFRFVPNSAVESEAAALGVSWLGAVGYLGVGFNVFDTLYGIPGHDEQVRIDLKQRRFDVRGGWQDLGGVIEGVSVRLGMNDYGHVELEGEAIGTRFANDATELRFELLHRPAGRWSGAFGVQLGERRFAVVGAEAFVPPVDSKTFGVFIVEQLELSSWELSLGGRIESDEHEPSTAVPSYSDRAASLSFGGVRAFGDALAFVATLALSERLPVAEELYSDGPHLATGVVQIGDSALDREQSRHVDLALRGELPAVNWSLTGFHTQYDDFIYLADTGAVDAEEELPVFAYSQADADFSGFEAEVFVALLAEGVHEVDLRLFADYVRGELASGESLPRLPPLRYGARFEYHNERWLAGIEATRYDDQDDTGPFETETEGYFLLNADLRWRLRAAGATDLEIFASATNLGDDEARKHTSFVKDVAPLPGRNLAFGIRSRF